MVLRRLKFVWVITFERSRISVTHLCFSCSGEHSLSDRRKNKKTFLLPPFPLTWAIFERLSEIGRPYFGIDEFWSYVYTLMNLSDFPEQTQSDPDEKCCHACNYSCMIIECENVKNFFLLFSAHEIQSETLFQ